MGDGVVGIAHDTDRNRLREQFAILAFAYDLAMPGAGTANRRAHLRPEVGAVNPGAKQVGRLADGLGG